MPVVLVIMLRRGRAGGRRAGRSAGEQAASNGAAGAEAATAQVTQVAQATAALAQAMAAPTETAATAQVGAVETGAVPSPAAAKAAQTGPALQADGVCAGYGRVQVLHDVRLSVAPGEFVALVGPNGSGKSTLLRALDRTLPLTGGTVLVCGDDASGLSPAQVARRIAAMSTDRRPVELLTCADVVELGRYPYTGRTGALTARDRAVVREAMDLAGVWALRDRDYLALSDGQRQRVLIARALCQQPRVLLLDEPTTFLDVRYKMELLELVRRLARARGIAVVASLHELDLAQKVADTVVCLREGSVESQGTPEGALTREGVARLFGIADGSGCFDPLLGGVEMPRPAGAPQVFVSAGGASGAATFRRLRRAGTPFAAGILREGDLDWAVACDLATEVIALPSGADASYETAALARAREVLAGCQSLLLCGGPYDDQLASAARELGIPVA